MRWILLLGRDLLLSLRAMRLYEARSRIAILKDSPSSLSLKEGENSPGEDWDYTVALDTQSGILRSEALALQVIRELRLSEHPVYSKTVHGKPAEAVETALLKQFAERLTVTSVAHTRLLEIRFVSPDPRLSTEIVNTLVRDFIEQNFRTRFETTMQTSGWLATQIEDLRAKVELSQQRLVEYQKRNGILGLDEKQNIVMSRLDQLNQEMTEAQALRMEKEARYHNALASSPELSVDQKQQGIPEPLRMRYAELKQQYAKLTTEFGPAYPRVIELKNELEQVRSDIESERSQISTRLLLEYQTAARRESLLASALNAQKQEANQLNQNAVEYGLLKRDADSSRQLYEGLLQKMKESSVMAGLHSSNIRVIDPARIPAHPISPNLPQNMGIGIALGTLLGVLAAFLAEHLDNTIHTPEEAQRVACLPTLGIVPLKGVQTRPSVLPSSSCAREKATAIELISLHLPQSPLAESYRSLRTSILLSVPGARPRILLVTSCLPQEGKTTTAINTATVLAETGARVLLVDADLRRPMIHNRLGVPREPGLSTLLSGSCIEEEAIISSLVPGLSVMPAGPTPPRPAELLGSQEMASYVAKWRQQYDYVVFDSCPVLPITDAVLLSVIVDSVMLVVRPGAITRAELRRATNLLLQVKANLSGLVINAADLHDPEYRSYGKQYRYYASAG
jgi:capsular exopolysaccharide synthesis family protein